MSPISRSVENCVTHLSCLLTFFAVLVVLLSIEVNVNSCVSSRVRLGGEGASCNRVLVTEGLQTNLLRQIILQDDSVFVDILSMSCIISCEPVDTLHSYAILKEKRYYRTGVTCNTLGHLISFNMPQICNNSGI